MLDTTMLVLLQAQVTYLWKCEGVLTVNDRKRQPSLSYAAMAAGVLNAAACSKLLHKY